MPMPSRHTLEFPRVLELLARQTSFSASTELAEALAPSSHEDEVQRAQEATEEARRLLDARPNAAVRGAHDIRTQARHAALGGTLQPKDLLEIASTVAAGRWARKLLLRPEIRAPVLAQAAHRIADLDELEYVIHRCLDDDGNVLDSASERLRTVRAELRTAHDRLVKRLNELVASPALREALQEPIITLRRGRYVLPIRAELRGRVPGIVHDQSASGATVYIEPLSVVDLANQWRQRGIEEHQEIERVLREMSRRVGSVEHALNDTVEALATIDFSFAKAKLAQHMDAVRPVLQPAPGGGSSEDVVHLVQARHPLLKGEVVPIDVELGRSFDILLISGPNTGGKTVAIKTVGLLALMAQAGLQIPAAPGSGLAVFSGVYADIGDEQSIEQSLSTFSSHVARIIETLASADRSSLVLLDEVGAGTDPQEGSALGRALLAHLATGGISTIATTHHSDLKVFAASTPRVQNASVEFDVETLRPTYRLIMGLPGQSNALTIAERLGMPPGIVEDARQLLTPGQRRADELLAEISQELARTREERAAASRLRAEAERSAEELSARLAALEQEREAIVGQAGQEAAALIAEVQKELDGIRRQLRRQASRGTVKGAEEQLEQLRTAASPPRGKARRAESEVSYQPGDPVTILSLQATGVLRSLSDVEAEVEVGGMRIRVPASDLQPSAVSGQPSALSPQPSAFSSQHSSLDSQLDLRGLTAEEARERLDRYLSDAYLAGLEVVRLIHGKGTGVLRQTVGELLTDHPLVRSHQAADPRHGGEGATVVHLAL